MKKGSLSYADFSKWLGGAIHQPEGFYFRHDSIKNPPFEENLHKRVEKFGNIHSGKQKLTSKELAEKERLLSLDVEKTVIDKIQFQWKTLKKAFIDLNKEKTGSIMPQELKNYLKHWGIYLDDD